MRRGTQGNHRTSVLGSQLFGIQLVFALRGGVIVGEVLGADFAQLVDVLSLIHI